MKDSKKVLEGMLNSVQMGQLGIRSVLDRAVRSDLRRDLHAQLAEYDTIETEVQQLASKRGSQLKEINPAVRIMSNMMSRMKMCVGSPDSQIAAMMIQGNTRGMILGLKDIHRSPNTDQEVKDLSQKLLDMEHANIQQMQGYL